MPPRANKSVKKPKIREENEVEKAAKEIFSDNGSVGKEAVLSQELKLARILSGNDPLMRVRVLKNLRFWLQAREKSVFEFNELDFMRIWKGLFYCMWMTDKPLPQEEMTEKLASLVSCFEKMYNQLDFYKCFLATMVEEWNKIDKWRLDKFMMVR